MNIKVSIGEGIDKLSVLELKQQKIQDEEKQKEIQKEISELHAFTSYKTAYPFYYKLLMHVNEKIWDMTDLIKTMSVNEEFAKVSNDIFNYNQKRFRIKNWFNLITSSDIKEQKSYSVSHCTLVIKEGELFNKIPEINSLLLDYDFYSFDSEAESTLKQIFMNPTLCIKSESSVIELSTYNLACDRDVFEFAPITYISGGLLGDFIQSLSVVCENFYKTGRKGIVYVSDKGEKFRNGLEPTYKDTYKIIMNQPYILDYKIYSGEQYDIDLTDWRNNLGYKRNLYCVYSETYNVEWGKHKWLTVDKDDTWSNKVVVNTTSYRWPLLNFDSLYNTYGTDLIFVGSDIEQYNFFVKKTNLKLTYYEVTDFDELCSIIYSCKLFVGSLSAPLSIAHALHVNIVCGIYHKNGDYERNIGFDKIWPNIRYSV